MKYQMLISALIAALATSAQAAEFKADPALVAAASKEGAVTIYTANQLESEQQLAKRFNTRFPDVKIEIVRAPGSRLIARVDAEAASGKLAADIIEFSDSGLAKSYEKLLADYAPANAGKYPAEIRAISAKMWPKTAWGYVLAYNKALVKNPPKSWADLSKPDFDEKLGWIPAGAGGTSWTLAMFQRKVLGESEWKNLATKQPVMHPSDSPLLAAVIRGEVRVVPLKTNSIIPAMKDGAPIGIVYPADGVPMTVSVAGISATAPHPNAARLYLDWILSEEGQETWVNNSGGMTVLAGGSLPEGAEKAGLKLWFPSIKEYAELRNGWVNEWNTVFNYRQ
ncbi:MAG: extracellular solute-binding protein [Hyphomicrobiaceae bacterium]|nr:extracellular solute-binding protein [Hyphomicrobiaceae bacterium]